MEKQPPCSYCFEETGELRETIIVRQIEGPEGAYLIRQCLKCKIIQP